MLASPVGAPSGPGGVVGEVELQRTDLSSEALRLTRMLHGLLPDDGEVARLLALMLLTAPRHYDEAARAEDTDWRQIPKGATSSRKRPG